METQRIHFNFISKKFRLILSLLFMQIFLLSSMVSAAVPRPDHVVICILENHGYPQVVGSSNAPYIDYLAAHGANLQEFYALTHPSQPNYIMMFSGSNQGVVDNNVPPGTPWTSPNLGASLIQAGFSFKGYSEDLPTVGSTVATSGAYARKHSPWTHWQGNGTNQIPSTCNVPFSDFPTNFNLLPDVSIIIPNLNNDMHNGTDPSRIISGDEWVRQNLGNYISWAQNNNSLFILTFDEDNALFYNRIPCIFVGPMVETGNYATLGYDLYDFLRTLQDMYSLPYTANSATSEPINEIWRMNAGIKSSVKNSWNVTVAPNPVTAESKLFIQSSENIAEIRFQLFNILGSKVFDEQIHNISGPISFPLKPEDLNNGVYFYKIQSQSKVLASGKVIFD